MTRPLCAAVDIGSATFHPLIARLDEAGGLRTHYEESVRPMLGARRAPDGTIPPDAEADVQAALRHYQGVAAELGVRRLLVVATQAIRAAGNGGELVTRWQERLAQPIHVLTAAQETRLAMIGAYGGAIPDTGLFADSGGASTQVASIAGGALLWQRSLPLGASALTAAHLPSDPPTASEVAVADGAVLAGLAVLPPPPAASTGTAPRPVITGGSASTLQALALPGCTAGTLTMACLSAAQTLLAEEPSPALAQRFQLPPERARILCAGCLIVRRLVQWSGYDTWRASVAGIREGMIRAWSADPEHWLARLTEPGRGGVLGPVARYRA
jgi:exopolyphosphatase / guanosine-5'-triphosphate,3'-diphosphate pyrophosphatase